MPGGASRANSHRVRHQSTDLPISRCNAHFSYDAKRGWLARTPLAKWWWAECPAHAAPPLAQTRAEHHARRHLRRESTRPFRLLFEVRRVVLVEVEVGVSIVEL